MYIHVKMNQFYVNKLHIYVKMVSTSRKVYVNTPRIINTIWGLP